MEEKTDARKDSREARDIILDLNFVPQWARKPPGENHYTRHVDTEESRPPRRNDRRPPRREGSRDERPRRPRPAAPPVRREPLQELPVSVSFLPEQKRLASLVRQIHHSRRAYPLMDLANLLIHDSNGYLVKMEVNKEASGFELYQCRQCKAVASSEEVLVQHILSNHLADFFEAVEVETEPPSGNFPGVARCRLTGTLLGPPNHHSYAVKLAELHQARFAHMPLEEFKRNIEVVKDEELVEQWRQECCRQTLYRSKSDPEAEPVDLRKAEAAFSSQIQEICEAVLRAIIPADIARKLEDRNVTHAIERVWSKESRFPLSMSFAMRAAFRHMHLHLFKAGRVNFVTHIKPHPINPEDAVENIAEVLTFLKENPGSTRGHMLEVLHPSLQPGSAEAQEALKPLAWLIERGHIIEFFNGTLAVPLGRRHR